MVKKVKQRGDFDDLRRRVRRGVARGLRDLTLEAKRQVQRENPVDTGRSRAAWAARFDPARLRGVVGNNVWYIRLVAEGGRIRAHTVRAKPSTPRERRNLGFHRRGAEKALRRAPELLLRALRQAGVPIK